MFDLLRCPLDQTVRLEQSDDGLVCQRCRLRYPIRQGIPCLIPEEGALPPGVDALSGLPCQKGAPLATPSSSPGDRP